MSIRRFVHVASRVSLLSVLALIVPPSLGGTIGLRWDASPGAAGYRVWWGSESGVYTSSKTVGNVLRTTVDALDDCQTTYFALTAYNAAGESDFSAEVASWPRPSIGALSPGGVQQGTQFTLVLQGANFEPGSTLEIDHPGVFLGSPSVLCNEIRVAATAEPTAEGIRPAETGIVALNVRGPGGLSTSTGNLFEILVNPARFDVNRSDATTVGRLDGRDTIWIARRFGASEPGPLYDPDLDFNGDGWIDGSEISLLGTVFGRCWNGSAWTMSACSN